MQIKASPLVIGRLYMVACGDRRMTVVASHPADAIVVAARAFLNLPE